jgi:hypothetical protein
MSKARELIEALASEGKLESRGSFTLDRDKAREKLQKFQLAEPERYVVLLAEAALMGGAERIDVKVDGDDLRMSFDGPTITRESLDGLWDAILSDTGSRPGLRQLALALNASMGLNPKFVQVMSANASQLHVLELRTGGQAVVSSEASTAVMHNFVHVRERLQFSTFSDAIDARRGERREQVLLKEHCRYVSATVTLDGEQISEGFPNKVGGCTVHFSGEGFRGCVGLGLQPSFASEFVFCSHGLKIVSHRFDDMPPGLVGVVNSTLLLRDVSQADVRRDEHFETLLSAVRNAAWSCLAQAAPMLLTQDAVASGTREWRPRDRLILLYQALKACGAEALQGDHPISPLLDQPLWKTVKGEARSTRELAARAEAKQPIPIIWESFEFFTPKGEEETLYVKDSDQRETLRALFGESIKCRHSHFGRALKRHKNEMRWRARRLAPVLPEDFWIRRVAFDDGKVRGEVGIRDREGRVDVLVEGGHLCSFELANDIRGLHMVLEGPFQPRKNFDGVHRNEAFAKGLFRAALAISDLLAEYFDSPAFHSPASSVSFEACVRFLTAEHFGLELLVAGGFSEARARRILTQLDSDKHRPELDPGAKNPHALTQTPLFRGTHRNAALSLADVSEAFSEDRPILYFDEIDPRIPTKIGGPPALILDVASMEFIEAVFDPDRLVDAVPVYRAWESRQRHLQKETLVGPMATLKDQLGLVGHTQIERDLIAASFALNGAALPSYWGDYECEASLEVRHLGRLIMTCKVAAGIPGILIVAEIPEGLCEADYSNMSEAGFAAVRRLLNEFQEGFDFERMTGWDLDRPQLLGLCRAIVWKSREAKDIRERLGGPLRPFTQRIELQTLQGDTMTLDELVESCRRAGYFEYCARPELGPYSEGPLIGNKNAELAFATAVLPFQATDIALELESRKRAKELLRLPAADELALSRPTLIELEVSEELESGKLTGRLGIPCVDPWEERGRLACYREMRHIESCENPLPLAVDAVLDTAWELGGVDEVRRDGLFRLVERRMQDKLVLALEQLLDGWTPREGSVKALRARWAVALCEHLGKDRVEASLWQDLLRRTMLGRFGASPTNVLALQQEGPAGKVTGWVDVDRAEFLNPPPGTLLLDAEIAKRLERAFGLRLRDASDALYQRRIARDQRPTLRSRVAPPWPPAGAFHSLRVEGHDEGSEEAWTAHLWIDAFERELQFGSEDRFVMEMAMWGGLCVSGVVTVPPSAVGDDWRSLISPPFAETLRKAGLRLIGELIDRLEGSEEELALVRHRLARMHAWLANNLSRLDDEQLRLLTRLRGTPLFRDRRDLSNAWVSIAERSAREAAAAHLAKEEHAKRKLQQSGRKRGQARPESRSRTDEVPNQATIDPKQVFREGLRELLDDAAQNTRWKPAEAHVDQVTLDASMKSRAYGVEKGPRLNPNHPVFAHTLASPETDRAALVLCASIASSAINQWLEEVTDADELALTLRFLTELS